MSSPRQRRRGVLLAGGGGTRFGGAAKGLLKFGGGRLADAAIGALRATCDDVVIAANDAAADEWFPGHEIVRDAVAGRGALGALETALLAGGGALVVVCAWDMPFVSREVLDQLATCVERGATCCVPVHVDGRCEPLCAAYAPSCAAVATALLSGGERAAHALLDAVGGVEWPIAAMLSPAAASRTFFNVNTPDDLQLAESWLSLPPHDTR